MKRAPKLIFVPGKPDTFPRATCRNRLFTEDGSEIPGVMVIESRGEAYPFPTMTEIGLTLVGVEIVHSAKRPRRTK
jgi:hypothetical protein